MLVILGGIAAVVFALSQLFVSNDTVEIETNLPAGSPTANGGPTHPPYVTPPTMPPPY